MNLQLKLSEDYLIANIEKSNYLSSPYSDNATSLQLDPNWQELIKRIRQRASQAPSVEPSNDGTEYVTISNVRLTKKKNIKADVHYPDGSFATFVVDTDRFPRSKRYVREHLTDIEEYITRQVNPV